METLDVKAGQGTLAANTFETRLRAAVSAGGWTLVVAMGMVLFQWLFYLAIMSARPAWVLSLFGPDVDWAQAQTLWLEAMVALKLVFWLLALVVLWGALWASKLRRREALRTRNEPSTNPAPRPLIEVRSS